MRRGWRRRRLGLSRHRGAVACGVRCSGCSILLDDACVRLRCPTGDRVQALLKSGDFLEEPLPTSPNAPGDRTLRLRGAPLSDVRSQSRLERAPLGHV